MNWRKDRCCHWRMTGLCGRQEDCRQRFWPWAGTQNSISTWSPTSWNSPVTMWLNCSQSSWKRSQTTTTSTTSSSCCSSSSLSYKASSPLRNCLQAALLTTGSRCRWKTQSQTLRTPRNSGCTRLSSSSKSGGPTPCTLSKPLTKSTKSWSALKKAFSKLHKSCDFPYFKSCSISWMSLHKKKIPTPPFSTKNLPFCLSKIMKSKPCANLFSPTCNKFSASSPPFQSISFLNLSSSKLKSHKTSHTFSKFLIWTLFALPLSTKSLRSTLALSFMTSWPKSSSITTVTSKWLIKAWEFCLIGSWTMSCSLIT